MSGGFDALLRVASESVLWQLAVDASSGLKRAWAGSATVAVIDRARRTWESQDPVTRVSNGAFVTAWAAVFYFVLLSLTPRYVASGLPSLGIAACAVAAAGVAIFARSFTHAWQESRLRGFLNSARDA